jgi:hypothetical protein
MKVWSTLSMLALAGAMFASPVAAGHPEGKRSWLPDSPSEQERKLDAAEVPPGGSIEGQVAAIDHDTGRMILDTQEGPISLTAAPEDLHDIEVGDMVRVSLATDTRL